MGVDIRVETFCDKCSTQKWYSFLPSDDTMLHEGNVRLTAATIFSGNTYQDIKAISENLNMQILSSSTFHRLAAKYVYPTIDQAYHEHAKKELEEVQKRQQEDGSKVNLAMDGRFSRPGFTATFGTVTAMDLKTHKILAATSPKRTDEEIESSPQMEIEGVQRILDSFVSPCTDEPGPSTSAQAAWKLDINAVVTDDSAALIKLFKTYPGIIHASDPWHLLKNVRKRLNAVAKKASCRELGFWIKSIDNFLWTTMKNCGGNGDLLLEQWR